MSAYRIWKTANGETSEIVRLEDMPDCCRREADQTTSYEAEFECRVCGAAWKAG